MYILYGLYMFVMLTLRVCYSIDLYLWIVSVGLNFLWNMASVFTRYYFTVRSHGLLRFIFNLLLIIPFWYDSLFYMPYVSSGLLLIELPDLLRLRYRIDCLVEELITWFSILKRPTHSYCCNHICYFLMFLIIVLYYY